MDDDTSRLGSAQVRFNDYLGTAAADDASAVLDSRSLYEIAALDRERWHIVGMDLSQGDTTEAVVVYAIDRTAEPEAGEAGEAGDVAVTAFHLGSSTKLDAFLAEAFQRLSVRLVSATVTEPLIVAAHDHSRRTPSPTGSEL